MLVSYPENLWLWLFYGAEEDCFDLLPSISGKCYVSQMKSLQIETLH